MKTKHFLLAMAFTALAFTSCAANGGNTAAIANQPSGPFADSRDGKTYKTVRIGNQIWMAENLNYHGEDGFLGLCYARMAENCDEYGRLYDWPEAMSIPPRGEKEKAMDYQARLERLSDRKHQGVCPSGWHLPNDDEWYQFLDFVSSGESAAARRMIANTDINKRPSEGLEKLRKAKEAAAKKLKATDAWPEDGCKRTERKVDDRGRETIIEHDNCATDEFGFTALSAGKRSGGTFGGIENNYAGWWSASYLYHMRPHVQQMRYGSSIYPSNALNVWRLNEKNFWEDRAVDEDMHSIRCIQN